MNKVALQNAALAVSVLGFAATALMKLVPNPKMPEGVWLRPGEARTILVALVEIAIVIALLWPRGRRWASQAASIFLIGGSVLALAAMRFGKVDCGCFGGWIRLSHWTHLAVSGFLLVCLVPLTKAPRKHTPQHSLIDSKTEAS